MKKFTPKDYAVALYRTTRQLEGEPLTKAIKEFVLLLVKKRKFKQAKKITEEFLRYAKKEEGIVDVEITTARKLDKTVIAAIKEVFGKNVEATEKIDETLLGGFIAKTEDKIFDASLKTQLNKLKQSLI